MQKGTIPLNIFCTFKRQVNARNHISGLFVLMLGLATCWLSPVSSKKPFFLLNVSLCLPFQSCCVPFPSYFGRTCRRHALTLCPVSSCQSWSPISVGQNPPSPLPTLPPYIPRPSGRSQFLLSELFAIPNTTLIQSDEDVWKIPIHSIVLAAAKAMLPLLQLPTAQAHVCKLSISFLSVQICAS